MEIRTPEQAREAAQAIADYADVEFTKMEAADCPTSAINRIWVAANELVAALAPERA